MATTADERLASQVARELSSPEPAVHFGLTLVVATVVASPVLAAAAVGNQSVPMALALYLGCLIAAWLVVGLLAGAFAMAGRGRLLAQAAAAPVGDSGAALDEAPLGPSPSSAAESVGSNGAH